MDLYEVTAPSSVEDILVCSPNRSQYSMLNQENILRKIDEPRAPLPAVINQGDLPGQSSAVSPVSPPNIETMFDAAHPSQHRQTLSNMAHMSGLHTFLARSQGLPPLLDSCSC